MTDTPRGTLWLLRHGNTDWSTSGQHTGRTDIPLNAAGEVVARGRSGDLAGKAFALVLCSPLGRARQTAELAGVTPDGFDADLLEWDYGAWEGRTTADIRAELGDPTWTIWGEPIPPGDTPGEQARDVAVRCQRIIVRCMPHLLDGNDCLLVAHGHLLRILTATWLGLPAEDGRLWTLGAGSMAVLGWERTQPVIAAWNT